MKFDQLAGLIKAGFNEEQIRSIGAIMDTGTGTNTGTNTGTPTPTPTGTALPTPTVTPAPATPSTPAESPHESGDTGTNANSTAGTAGNVESETVSLLKEMLGIIQKGNINSVGTGAAAQETGVDVLAEILNPTPKTK